MKVIGADPYVLFDPHSKMYYAYATSGDVSEDGNQFFIYKSKDLINWEFVNFALDTSKKCWSKGWYWAPECYYNPNNKHYYLFYSALTKEEITEEYFGRSDYEECCKIGVAVSTSPEGPFVNINDRPMDYNPYDKDYLDINAVIKNPFDSSTPSPSEISIPRGTFVSSIDINLFFEDEKIFMYFSRCCYQNCIYDKDLKKYIEESNIVACELNTDWWFDETASTMPTVKKEYTGVHNDGKLPRKDGYVDMITYHKEPQDWENGHVNDYDNKKGKNRRWSEGSTTFTRIIDGKKQYCLTYSCNNFENELYGVGIAFGSSPLGEFKKFEGNPIIHQNKEESLYSTGHGCFVEKDGLTYYFFHGRAAIDEARVLYVGELHFNEFHNAYVDNIHQCILTK